MKYDITVIGAGHAGIEAAWIAAQLGQSVCLITLSSVSIGNMPCNPSIGGVGKGQVVREISMLGGLMPELADKSAIQCRILNESKGYAVRSTRFQVDKEVYSKLAFEKLNNHRNINLIREKLVSCKKANNIFQLKLEGNLEIHSKSVIVTAGTFLGAITHIGRETKIGGVYNSEQSDGFSKISNFNIKMKRFKTGTPARLIKNSIDFKKLTNQESDPKTKNFFFKHGPYDRFLPQLECYLTHTNSKTLKIIRDKKDESPLYNGQIEGVGPRYCPSIEDKAYRYLDRDNHHVFLEPEGINLNTIYPNGISTSLPKNVQDDFLRSIEGLENVIIEKYGYAVEYDVIDATELFQTLEHSKIEGLYFAGQVNGSSGYEEAAGQGLIAGINGSLKNLNKDQLILSRNDSYIGVLIDDITSIVLDEPYRLFTARAENRLFIREDNVVERMSKYRVLFRQQNPLDAWQKEFMHEHALLGKLVSAYIYSQNSTVQHYFEINNYGPIGPNLSLFDLIKRPKLDCVATLTIELISLGVKFREDVIENVAKNDKYSVYISRASSQNRNVQKVLLSKIDWKQLSDSDNISNECRQRITKYKPKNILQLKQISGIRPATISYVVGSLL